MRRGSILGIVVPLMLSGSAMAAEQQLAVVGAWSRATSPAAKTAAVYFTIIDKGAPDTLATASTPVAASAEVHQTVIANGIVAMRPVANLPVSSSGPVMFAPGGYHVMLEGLKQPLTRGMTFPVTLTFAKAGRVEATVSVEDVGAGGPIQDEGAGHDMDVPPGVSR